MKRFQWCPHIHAAVLCGGNKFKNDQQVYFHLSSRYNQLAHLRATCFDMASDVKPVENNEDAFAVMGWTTEWTPFSVLRSSQVDICHICPQYKRCPECSMCRHQYLCACAEYMVKKRLCEHCHVVSIFLSEYRVNTLKKREFRYLSDVSDDTDEEADPTRDASPIMLPLRKLAAHHEKSYSIPFKRIQAGSLNDQLVYFVRRCDPDQRFVVHTQNRAHCSCSKDSTSQNVECTDCGMCRHYLTCNCGEGDVELCKHTHAVRRYIVRSYTSTDRTLESALGSAVRRALSDFYESCDMAKIHSGPLLVTEENITAVIENLKTVLGSDVEVELPNPDKLSTSCDNSVKSRVYNVEAVLKEDNQVFDSEDMSNGKVPSEVDSCTTPNSDFFKNDAQNLEPVSEENEKSYSVTAKEDVDESAPEIIEHSFLNSNSTTGVCPLEPVLGKGSSDNSDINILAEINGLNLLSSNPAERSGYSLKPDLEKSCIIDSKADESAIVEKNPDFERQLPPVQKSDFIGTSHSEISLIVGNESQAETQLCSHFNSDSTNVNTMISSLDKSVDIDKSCREEFGMSKVVDSCMISDTSCSNWQLNPFLKNSIDGIHTSKMDGDEVAADINSRSFLNGSSQDATNNLVFRSDGRNISGVCEEKQNEVFTQFDYSSIKTLKSFYDLQFEPVLEIRYKGQAETIEGYPKVLAESSRCIVTVSDSTEESSPRAEPIPQQNFFCDCETKKEDENSVLGETCELSLVSKNLELCSIKESCPDLSTVPSNDSLYGFGIEEDIKNGVSLETCRSSLVVQDFESNPKGSVLNWKPVPIQNLSCCSGAERIDEKKFSTKARLPSVVSNAKDYKKNCTTESAPSAEPILYNFDHTCGGFDTEKEDKNLIPKEGSGSINFGKAFKQKSLNIMKKLNLAKYYKKPQKEDTSFSQFFGSRNWTRSRRRRELAVLQSISDDFEDTDVIVENFDLRRRNK